MKAELLQVLKNFKLPIFLTGTLNADEEYPDSFFTFWNNETPSDSFYDNESGRTIWDFDISFYSTDAEKVNRILLEAVAKLEQAEFIPNGSGYDVASDEPTHTGRGINILKIQRKE